MCVIPSVHPAKDCVSSLALRLQVPQAPEMRNVRTQYEPLFSHLFTTSLLILALCIFPPSTNEITMIKQKSDKDEPK